MPPDQIAAQKSRLPLSRKAFLRGCLPCQGTIILDPGRVARVPGRVEGTVMEMRKRLGDSVTQGEVVAVLDSREVADAKSEYLTASVALRSEEDVVRAGADLVDQANLGRTAISSGARNLS